jgi:hypothetical protein
MTYIEKIFLSSGIATVLFYGWYFFDAFANTPVDQMAISDFGPRMWTMIGAYIALMIIVTVVASMMHKGKTEEYDERDSIIDMKAERICSYAQAACIFGVLVLVMFDFNAFVIAHALLGTMVMATVIGVATRLYLYRRGF